MSKTDRAAMQRAAMPRSKRVAARKKMASKNANAAVKQEERNRRGRDSSGSLEEHESEEMNAERSEKMEKKAKKKLEKKLKRLYEEEGGRSRNKRWRAKYRHIIRKSLIAGGCVGKVFICCFGEKRGRRLEKGK